MGGGTAHQCRASVSSIGGGEGGWRAWKREAAPLSRQSYLPEVARRLRRQQHEFFPVEFRLQVARQLDWVELQDGLHRARADDVRPQRHKMVHKGVRNLLLLAGAGAVCNGLRARGDGRWWWYLDTVFIMYE